MTKPLSCVTWPAGVPAWACAPKIDSAARSEAMKEEWRFMVGPG